MDNNEPKLEYGRLHVRSTSGQSWDTELWVETKDGKRIGLPVTEVTLRCKVRGLWTATVETQSVKVEYDGPDNCPVIVRTRTEREYRPDFAALWQKEGLNEPRPDEGQAVP